VAESHDGGGYRSVSADACAGMEIIRPGAFLRMLARFQLDSCAGAGCSARGVELSFAGMTAKEDIASVAGQLALLTQTVEEMAAQLKELQKGADVERERSDIQQERIDLAARELVDVGDRLQAAASALRESI
jgi:hypothetical protein